jgi:hypothetical protein
VTSPQPTWLDDPDALNQLCDQGAADLYGEHPEPRRIHTVTPDEEYL